MGDVRVGQPYFGRSSWLCPSYAYNGYLGSGDPAFTSACGNFELLK